MNFNLYIHEYEFTLKKIKNEIENICRSFEFAVLYCQAYKQIIII